MPSPDMMKKRMESLLLLSFRTFPTFPILLITLIFNVDVFLDFVNKYYFFIILKHIVPFSEFGLFSIDCKHIRTEGEAISPFNELIEVFLILLSINFIFIIFTPFLNFIPTVFG